jgi:hypothetical protein
MPLDGSGKQGWIEIKWYLSASGLCWWCYYLGGSVYTVKNNAEALAVASTETGLEVNADKTKYMVMSRDRDVGRMITVPLKTWKSSNIWEQL